MTIQVVDYGASNLRSVLFALDRLKVPCQVVETGAQLQTENPILLPGVGHFGSMINGLHVRNLWSSIQEAIQNQTPLLGICLGMQVLYEGSEEAPESKGFGYFSGSIKRFPSGLPVPQMGWNQVAFPESAQDLFFANSFYAPIGPETVGSSEYTLPFSAMVNRGAVTGMQFHPEKSGAAGLNLLAKWCEEVQCSASA